MGEGLFLYYSAGVVACYSQGQVTVVTGTAGLVTAVGWGALFDLITDCLLFFPISSVLLKQTVRYCCFISLYFESCSCLEILKS